MGKGGSKNRPPEQKGGDVLENTAEASMTTARFNQIVICKFAGCHDIATTQTFCRFHYLSSWRKLKTKEAKRKGQELEGYLQEMSKKFPEEFLEKLKVEVEDMAEKEAASSDSDDDKGGMIDQIDGDDDLDTIIKGLKVEDF
jgi:hypothetical protein